METISVGDRRQVICIYHNHCVDGFTAAWVVHKYFSGRRDVVFFGANYYEDPPDIKNRHVFIVDFSYKRTVMKCILKDAASVVLLDHHKSAKEDLAGLVFEGKFDMEQSGAGLTWRYFYDGIEPPDLLLHVEDRDLWKFALPYTKEISAGLFSYPYSFKTWDELMAAPLTKLIADGTVIERKLNRDIAEILPQVTREMKIGGFTVLVANVPYFMASEAGQILAQDKPFGATYYDSPKGRHFSLRSLKGKEDVSKIAAKYQGGGHQNSGGFTVPLGWEGDS